MAIQTSDIKRVKGEGFLLNRGTEEFSGRIITENGVLTAKQMQILSQAAEKYGNGKIEFTSRLTVECPGIHYDNIPAFQQAVAEGGMVTGGTGSKVRPIVSCKGTTCVFGLYDTQQMAKELHEKFYVGYHDVILPHKFKIAVGGCPNNCVKPDLNDLGIVGQRVSAVKAEGCKGCASCSVMEECPMGAVAMQEGKALIDTEQCNNCGRCQGTCRFDALEHSETVYRVYVGGKWGKRVRMGSPLQKLFTREEVVDVVEKAILLFKQRGVSGERFGDTVERLGVDKVEKMLIADNLLHRKEEILEIETVAGAKC